jgi:ketosteroid isomerase-like protein
MARIAIFLPAFCSRLRRQAGQGSIDKLNAEWMAAFKGDAKALAAMYTPDAYVLPAGAGWRGAQSRSSGAAR